MSKLEIAKEKFYNFLVGAAGLRFKSRKDFDEVVDAIVEAFQQSTQSDFACTCRKNQAGEITKYHRGCPEHDPASK